MKNILTFVLTLMVSGIAVQAQEAEIQPLVREGVVWHYAYYKMNVEGIPEYGSSIIDYKVQFKGDTLVNGITYKKCYFFETERLDENVKPVMLAREVDGMVMFIDIDASIWTDEYSLACTTLPGEYMPLTGERIVYDFGNMADFITNLRNQNQSDDFFEMELLATDQVSVAGKTVNRYTLTGSFMYPNSYYVESVGVDGYESGYLFNPLVDIPTCICSGSLGLIKLTDLDGNVLYKGVNYEDFYTGISKMNDNMALVVLQNAQSLSVTVPCDGMVSVIDMAGRTVVTRVVTQGTTELPTASLSAGVYIVQLSTSVGTQTTKVVIK